MIDIYQDANDGGNSVGTNGTATGAYQSGEGNSMDIDQLGGNNMAGTETVQSDGMPSQEGGQGLVQLGDDNSMTLYQNGWGNEVSSVLQDGDLNKASVTQNSSNNVAVVSQIGSNNSAVITQN